jgi:hypothetical protein
LFLFLFLQLFASSLSHTHTHNSLKSKTHLQLLSKTLVNPTTSGTKSLLTNHSSTSLSLTSKTPPSSCVGLAHTKQPALHSLPHSRFSKNNTTQTPLTPNPKHPTRL